ncbi:MAG: conjugal transfer protein TrbE [Desulfovibrionaceae bacterium]|nr:conjugal transfer protein TrbE [Desulfovibrionaceae bacterium]MBF0514200.1 conjugal transfer protein TrbE [Desulfovibrionaceae bacterium]
MLALRRFRPQGRGVSMFLPYAALYSPGVVLCKDGSLLAGFQTHGPDTASSTDEELDFVSAQFNRASKLLGSNWMFHVDAVRSRYKAYSSREDNHFPDIVTRLIDDERRAYFNGDVYRTNSVIILTYKPSLGAEKLSASVRSGEKGPSVPALDRVYARFEQTLLEFEDALSSILRLHRLEDYTVYEEGGKVVYSELLAHLQLCVSGVDQPVRVPRVPMYLDSLLGSEDLVGGLAPRIGEKNIGVLGIDGLPQESWPAMLSLLDGMNLQYRFSTRFIGLDQYDAQQEITSYRKGWQQGVYRFIDKLFNNPNARANRDAAAMVEDAEEALAEVQGGYIGAGYLSSNIVLLHEDPETLNDWCRELRRTLLGLGFGCRIESINSVDAWLGTHPGNWFASVRRPLINTLTLADLLPLASVWVGEKDCPCPFYPPGSPALMVCTTQGSTPFWFNLHVGDIAHTMILGPTGSGKSTLLALIAAQFRKYKGSQVIAFDKGMSLYPLCKAVGGAHYNIGETSELSFAPLQRIDDPNEQAWAEEWIATLLELQEVTVGPAYRNAIHAAMDLLKGNSPNMRSLSDFVNLVQDKNIREGLQHYTRHGAMGHLLDAETDSLHLSSFVVFEIETLMNLGDKNVIPVLLYLFRRIKNSLKGQPALMLLDEAWVVFGNKVFSPKIREFLKTFRKENCGVVMATQSLSDASKSEIIDVLIESCPTVIFLANPSAKQDIQAELYRSFGLNGKQIDIIANATPKRDYYVVSTEGRRLVQLAIQKKTLSFVGVSDKENIARIKELESQYDQSWYERWLEERSAI